MKKLIRAVMTCVMVAAASFGAYASEDSMYLTSRDKNAGINIGGSVRPVRSGPWLMVEGEWYYLDTSDPHSDYLLNSCWVGNYYLDEAGRMARNLETPGGYYVGADGLWIPGYDTSAIPKKYDFQGHHQSSVSVRDGMLTMSGPGHQYFSNGHYFEYDYFNNRTVQYRVSGSTRYSIGNTPVSLEAFLQRADEGNYEVIHLTACYGEVTEAEIWMHGE